jgi:hypothetical protein
VSTLPAELAGRVLADSRDREAWLRARAGKIGGSNAASFSKIESAPLYLRALLHNPFDGNQYTRHGNDRERRILAAYGIEQNTLLLHADPNGDRHALRHVATPDGFVAGPGPRTLAQAKTFNHPIKSIEPKYRRQMWWEQYVTGAERTLFVFEQHENFTPVAFEPDSLWLDRDDSEIDKLITIANIILDGLDAVSEFTNPRWKENPHAE